MKKRITSMILALVLVISLLPVTARAEDEEQEPEGAAAETGQGNEENTGAARANVVDSGTCGAEGDGTNLFWELDSNGTLTISGAGEMMYYQRTGISPPWSSFRDRIIRVYIEPGVTSIGNMAFQNCTNLVSVMIPDSVTYIGTFAFYGCDNLSAVTMSKNVATIESYAFGSCPWLNNQNDYYQDGFVIINGNLVKYLGTDTHVAIPDGVTAIVGHAFENTNVADVDFPPSVSYIGGAAFGGATETPWLASQGEFVIVNGILHKYRGTDTNVVIPDEVTAIGESAFEYYNRLTSVTIPDSVTRIDDAAFFGCDSLTSITIPDGVISIGDYAFFDCSSLIRMPVPQSVSSIGAYAFYQSGGLYFPGGVDRYDTVASVVGRDYGLVAFLPTISCATTQITPGAVDPTVVITSDTPFREGVSTADIHLADTATGLTLDSVTLAQVARAADNRTLTLQFSGIAQKGDLDITVLPGAFDVIVATMNGPVYSVIPTISVAATSEPDPTPEDPPTTPTRPTQPNHPIYIPTPAPAPSVNPEGELPGADVAPPPEPMPPESPIQGIVKDETGIVDWIDRINPPEYAKTLYDTLVDGSGGGSGKTPPYLVEDQYFALPPDSTAVDGQEVLYVECVDFDLADLFAGQDISLGVAVFEDDDFFRVPDHGERVNYAALKLGDAVKTSSFNGIFVTSVPKSATFNEDKKTMASYVSTVFQAFDRDHPEVFWLSNKCRVRIPVVREGDGTERAYFFLVLTDSSGFTMRSPDWVKDGAVAEGIKRREAAIETILDTVTAKTPAEIVRQLNRWLTEHNQYNTTPDLTTIGNEPHECLSALEGRIGRDGPVCDGYSRAFKTLCDRLNIPCVLENGYAKTSPDSKGGFHMWNAVEIGGQWYGVDVTWNDPTVKGSVGAKSGKENEQFLLVGADTVVRKMTFAASHPAINKASVDGVSFDNGPSLNSAAFSAVTANAGLSALPFDDVPEDAWYYDSVAYVYEWNLMMGTGSNTFSPGRITTRQQLWMILARMSGKQPRSMEAAREWAMNSGVSDGSNPGGQLTREQLVTMLYRYCEAKGYDVSASASLSDFPDAGNVSEYAQQAMRWAVANGIIKGMGSGTITPQGTATRAQMAAIIERMHAK